MKLTVTYLNEAKEALNLTSDYQLAKWLNVSTAALARYQSGQRTIDDYACVRIAEALKIDPLEVITAANFEREKDSGRKAFWANFSRTGLAASIALVLLGCSMIYSGFGEGFSPEPLSAEGSVAYTENTGKSLIFNDLFIMRNWEILALGPAILIPLAFSMAFIPFSQLRKGMMNHEEKESTFRVLPLALDLGAEPR